MPRFLVEQRGGEPVDEAAAAQLAAERFPEVAVEHRYLVHGGDGERELWVCRAPSESHLRRWARATGLSAVAIEHVDGDAPPARPSQPQHKETRQ